MRGDSTECTSPKASPVNIDRKFYHVERRNSFPLIFRMRQTRIRQVERHIEFPLRHGRVRRIDHNHFIACLLINAGSFVFVRFFFYVSEVLSLLLFILQTFFVRKRRRSFLRARTEISDRDKPSATNRAATHFQPSGACTNR